MDSFVIGEDKYERKVIANGNVQHRVNGNLISKVEFEKASSKVGNDAEEVKQEEPQVEESTQVEEEQAQPEVEEESVPELVDDASPTLSPTPRPDAVADKPEAEGSEQTSIEDRLKAGEAPEILAAWFGKDVKELMAMKAKLEESK